MNFNETEGSFLKLTAQFLWQQQVIYFWALKIDNIDQNDEIVTLQETLRISSALTYSCFLIQIMCFQSYIFLETVMLRDD